MTVDEFIEKERCGLHVGDTVEFTWSSATGRRRHDVLRRGEIASFSWSGHTYGGDEIKPPYLTARVFLGKVGRHFAPKDLRKVS
jgi:hypothetical protein